MLQRLARSFRGIAKRRVTCSKRRDLSPPGGRVSYSRGHGFRNRKLSVYRVPAAVSLRGLLTSFCSSDTSNLSHKFMNKLRTTAGSEHN